jgi:hypothetical protein
MGTFSPWYRLILVQRRSTKFFLESPLLTAVFFFSRWGSGHGGPSFAEVNWVISQAGQPEGQPDLKKPTALRGAVGVWDCESSDRIKGL